MLFKQVQLFQLPDASLLSREVLDKKLSVLAFSPCSPSQPLGKGWVAPAAEEPESLVRAIPGYLLFCLQIEEKILPASVIRQALQEKIKNISETESRKVYQKEKLQLKDEITMTLLPRAFSKLTKIYAYIDLKNRWLVLGTDNAKRTEQFIAMFQKSVTENIIPYDFKPISSLLTQWLRDQDYPNTFSIEKSAVLQDSKEQKRVIRCQQQDLSAAPIQSFLTEGCKVKQLALCWRDSLFLTLSENFSITNIKFQDEIISQAKEAEVETQLQQFDTDFMLMAGTFLGLFTDLLPLCLEEKTEKNLELATV